MLVSTSYPIAAKVALRSSPYVGEASHTIPEAIGRDMAVCLSRVANTASGHGRIWTKTRECHGRVRGTGHGHERVLGRVKTPVGSNLELSLHGFGARACSLVPRPCQPHGPLARPGQKGHTGVLPFHTGVYPCFK
ncbi:Uncharacterized protein F383_32843 [Gossypium arboreum]|uniref:Uncharacterized protein n=1 Tax=Gossypium arboreum TaxID=29729 RepID=A0A0B0N3R6_GOSAR|nr:Uncharacterized protein F383_32843 [Gossypium arboreum]